jgi:hypothetical protein
LRFGFLRVTNGETELATAPALKALGGWADAPWFSSSVLTDTEVVGFQFPPLPGVRKQSFQITDRSMSEKTRPGKAAKAPVRPPKRMAGKLANILDSVGATMAVACRRSRFLFETAPILFFAEIPSSKLKARPANKLRRELIEIEVLACVVSFDGPSATVMFWPAVEDAITDFVQAAAPEYPIHLDFLKSPPSARDPAPKSKNDGNSRSDSRADDRERKLLREVATLRQQVEKLQQSQSVLGAMEKLGLDDARLKSMLTLLHPDKHGGSDAANDATKWINQLRDLLKGRSV